MAQEIVLRKTSRSGNKVCKTYSITQPSYRFTLETCDNIEATIKDNKGLTVSILSLNAPTALVTKKGNYNICIEGEGVGTLYAEWTSAGSNTQVDCCDELRLVDAELQTQINNLKSRVTTLETKVNNIITGQTTTGCCESLLTEINNLKQRVTELENSGGSGGGGSTECCDALQTEINNLKTRLTTIEGDITNLKTRVTTVEGDTTNLKTRVTTVENRLNNQTITGGTGISVSKNGDSYTITNTSSGGGGLPSDFDIKSGTNVTVSKNENEYTVSSSRMFMGRLNVNGPNGGMAVGIGFTNPGNNLDTMIIQAGENVTIGYNGSFTDGTFTISATDTKPDVTKAYVDQKIAAITDTDTKPILKEALTVTCNLGGIEAGTVYAKDTPLEDILRALLTCPETPVDDTYLIFTSHVTDLASSAEEWDELTVDKTTSEYIINLADTYEEIPVKFDIPVELNNVITDIQLFNKITSQWVSARDFDSTNITRTINGQQIPYVRYTDNREVNGIGRPVKLIWAI